MDDIAREAGISRPSIYQYFRNKEEVVLAAIEVVVEQAFDVAELAHQNLTEPKEKIREFLCAYMLYYFNLVVSGPHSEELMNLKNQFGNQKPDEVRLRLAARLNRFLGYCDKHETGFILASSAEGIKLHSPDENKLRERISTLVHNLA